MLTSTRSSKLLRITTKRLSTCPSNFKTRAWQLFQEEEGATNKEEPFQILRLSWEPAWLSKLVNKCMRVVLKVDMLLRLTQLRWDSSRPRETKKESSSIKTTNSSNSSSIQYIRQSAKRKPLLQKQPKKRWPKILWRFLEVELDSLVEILMDRLATWQSSNSCWWTIRSCNSKRAAREFSKVQKTVQDSRPLTIQSFINSRNIIIISQ